MRTDRRPDQDAARAVSNDEDHHKRPFRASGVLRASGSLRAASSIPTVEFDGRLTKLIYWYDIAVFLGIFIVVGSAFLVIGRTTPAGMLNAVAVSLIVFGLLYLLAGLRERLSAPAG